MLWYSFFCYFGMCSGYFIAICCSCGGDFIVLLWLTITLQRRVHTPLQGLCHALTMWLSGLLLPLTVWLHTWDLGHSKNPHLHSSRSLLLKPTSFTGWTPPLHTLPAYEPTCASVLSGHIDSLVVAQTHSPHCHYVPRPTAVNCFALPPPVSQ